MKNSIYYYCSVLFLAFIFSNSSFAQENTSQIQYSIYGGAALPQGDFSSTSVKKAGFANTGFCAMIESSNILSESMNWISSFSLAVNSVDEVSMENQLSGITVTTGNYLTSWIMTGIGFQTIASPTVKIYSLGQIGLLLSKLPDITFSSGGQSITQTTNTGTAFAYGFGAGVITK